MELGLPQVQVQLLSPVASALEKGAAALGWQGTGPLVELLR